VARTACGLPSQPGTWNLKPETYNLSSMDAPTPLEAYGWTPFFAEHFAFYAAQGLVPGRVSRDHQRIYRVYTEQGEAMATVAGRLRHHASSAREYPVVGDWVSLRPLVRERRTVIQAILPRISTFSRKVAGSLTGEQVVAANVDTIFLTQGLDDDFNLRRIERYLLLAWESGASPVIILNKADLCDDVPGMVRQVEAIAPGVPVHATSARRQEGFEPLTTYLVKGRTVALLGSSGVGKSTLINRLLGRDLLRTGEVRPEHSRGRHTTTHRELVLLPSGALVIDTPGLRELQLWEVAGGIDSAFADIDQLAALCHFRDCRHEGEPRCAVRQAVADGVLSAERLENYVKLRLESRYLAERQDQLAQIAKKHRWRTIHRTLRNFKPRE
jgi:ribosome biogenesis GTPase